MDDIHTTVSSSPLYPLLLFHLMLENYTPEVKTSFNYEYDYIIIGAGSAGSVVANRLSEDPRIKVLLLEAGSTPPVITEVPGMASQIPETYLDWNYYTEPQEYLNNKRLLLSLGKAIGGSSAINGMYNVRGVPKDYDNWVANGAFGWTYMEVLPYFKKLENFTVSKYFEEEYYGSSGPVTIEQPNYNFSPITDFYNSGSNLGYMISDCNGLFANVFFDITATLRNGRRCSTAKAYLLPASRRENLDIVANAFVRKVIIEDLYATSVEVEFDGKIHQISARKEIILSAGAIHTPHILMLSGIGPKGTLESLQIPVIVDLPVGQNYHTHSVVNQPYVIDRRFPTRISKLKNESYILQYINYKTGPLNYMNPTAFLNSKGDTSPDAIPDIQIYLFDQDNKYGSVEKERVLICVPGITLPKSRGYVTINSINPHDPPVVDPKLFAHPDDIKDTVEALKLCDKLMSHEAFGNLNIQGQLELEECNEFIDNEDLYLECVIKYRGDLFLHSVGTAKMGDVNDPTTVVDSNLRVHGIHNLRVVDASVMPQITSGNTNTPTIMIGEKASDMIKSRIEGCSGQN